MIWVEGKRTWYRHWGHGGSEYYCAEALPMVMTGDPPTCETELQPRQGDETTCLCNCGMRTVSLPPSAHPLTP